MDDDPLDPETWPKANPNLHVSAKVEVIEELADAAREVPAEMLTLKRYYCNIRTESAQRAIPDALWQIGNLKLPVLTGRLCHGGTDLGWRDDLASLTLVFPPQKKSSRRHYVKSWSWICSDGPRDLEAEPWAGWIASGALTVTPGNTTDCDAIQAKIAEVRKTYQVRSIALDGANARQFGTDLVTKGCRVFEHAQNHAAFNEPTREMLKLLREGNWIHGGDDLLSFAAKNLTTHTNASGLIKPDKQKSPEKIDPMVAGIQAQSECMFFKSRTKSGSASIRTLG